MNSIIKPAVYLMNRMSFITKFILINIIFIAPLSLFSYLQLSEIQYKKSVTTNELVAVKQLADAIKLTHISAKLRNYQITLGENVGQSAEENLFKDEYLATLKQIKITKQAWETLNITLD